MKITDSTILNDFRGPGICDFCGMTVRAREAAHVFACGRGSGFRLDIRINLVALCAPFAGGKACHAKNHAGFSPTKDELIAVVAKREGYTEESLRNTLHALRWAEPDSNAAEIMQSLRRAV